ncbi:MAG: alpha/beta hydrolase family protein [Promethearchaeota archaeon]
MIQKFKQKLPKRIVIFSIGIIVSMIIWNINANWGNSFEICLLLSTTTFLIIYIPFEIYWSFWDIWFERWIRLKSQYLESSKVRIKVDIDKFLGAIVVKSKNQEKVISKNAIIIINHGFSDNKETLQYYYFPLALQGYVILAYDARGTGSSKKIGKKKDFLNRIEDHDIILDWIKKNENYKDKKIYTIGFSIGAMVALCSGFPRKDVHKIIAISSVSNYRKNVPKYNPIILISYMLKGVSLHPSNENNQKLSPYLIFQSIKKKVSEEEWNEISKKVFLIHCINDHIIKFKNFKENQSILNIPTFNQVIFKKGGHSLKKNEIELVGATLRWLSE